MFRRLAAGTSPFRNAATMATTPSRAPSEPLLVVLGSTGTGKSELAVELAARFRGEIINADAMQLYNGLPIITNKIPPNEQRGIPHHLLGHIPLGEAPWTVNAFKQAASSVIREIRARGNLPILVGGTQYYVDPLLFKDITLDDMPANPDQTFPILEQPTEDMLEELKKVDPVMAERWHPNDRRKIQRSLEIYLRTGKPASEFYAEQQSRKSANEDAQRDGDPWETLLLWIHSEREVLKERLGRRVDKMLEAGLLDEVQQLREFKRDELRHNKDVDMTKGIWQSIGYKQFEPYLEALDEGQGVDQVKKLKATALEDMKAATRRYAKYQTRWIRLKQIPLLKEAGPGAFNSLYLLDSTDVSQFSFNVVEPAAQLTAQFLAGRARPLPVEMSDMARQVLEDPGEPPPKESFVKRTCELCQTVAVNEMEWQRHIKGAAHRRMAKKKKKLALVPVEAQALKDSEVHDGASDRSEPEIASIFD